MASENPEESSSTIREKKTVAKIKRRNVTYHLFSNKRSEKHLSTVNNTGQLLARIRVCDNGCSVLYTGITSALTQLRSLQQVLAIQPRKGHLDFGVHPLGLQRSMEWGPRCSI